MGRASSSKQKEPAETSLETNADVGEIVEWQNEEKSDRECTIAKKNQNNVDDNKWLLLLLPPGYRFCPRDEELVKSYLTKKVLNEPLPLNRIYDVNLYDYSPCDLARDCKPWTDSEWYFFTPRDRKYPNGKRPNRAAQGGYWKATGADRKIMEGRNVIGERKSLVFYHGKAMKGTKSDWIMHEFRIDGLPENTSTRTDSNMRLDDWVLCRIYQKKPKKNSEDKVKDQKEKSVHDQPSASQPPLPLAIRDTRNETPSISSGWVILPPSPPKSMDQKEKSVHDQPSASQPALPLAIRDTRNETPSISSGWVILPPSPPKSMDQKEKSVHDQPSASQPALPLAIRDARNETPSISSGWVIRPPSPPKLMESVNLACSNHPDIFPQHNYSQVWSEDNRELMSRGDLIFTPNDSFDNRDFIDQFSSQPETMTSFVDDSLFPFESYDGQSQYGFIDTNQGCVNNFAAGMLPPAGSDNDYMTSRWNDFSPVLFNSQLPPPDALILNPTPVSERPFGYIDPNNDMHGGSVRGTRFMDPTTGTPQDRTLGYIDQNNDMQGGSVRGTRFLDPTTETPQDQTLGYIDQKYDMQGGSVRGIRFMDRTSGMQQDRTKRKQQDRARGDTEGSI